MHLATVLFVLLGIVFFLGSILLIPSYFVSEASADSYERYRDALEGAVGLKEREYVIEDVSRLSERIRIMDEYAQGAFSAGIIDSLGERVTNDIIISDISFGRAENGIEVSLSGTSATRQSLLAFVSTLRESSAFSQVSLPVSQLVVDENAPFSLKMLYSNE